ncbi:MAG: hypothetical protein ACFFD6_03195 [Candidatus Thorarchaeota archaeon]
MIMQIDYLLTQDTPLSLTLLIIGIIIWFMGSLLERPVQAKLLAIGFDDLPPMEHTGVSDTSYSKWCFSKYSGNTHGYDRVVNLMKVAGYMLIVLGSIVFFRTINPFMSLGPAIFMFYFTYLIIARFPTIEERARYALQQ